jgi:putative PIN family toxin of toxin-antitoxin system
VLIIAVIDTNVWVSAFLNPAGLPARLVSAGRAGRVALVTSTPLLEELRDVLCRPRIMKVRQTTVLDAERFVQNVAASARLVAVSGGVKLCRDPDDNWLLETAFVGEATHVVSRDEDVTRDLELVHHLQAHGIQSVTVSRFLAYLDEET